MSWCDKYHVTSTEHVSYLMAYIAQYGDVSSMA